jgi:uncharacterized protein YgiM (DUF1202 family)
MKVKLTAGFKLIASLKLALSTTSSTSEATASAQLTGGGTPAPTIKPGTKTATSSATTADPAKPFVTIKDTPTGFLRVRADASSSASESGRVNPGEKYHVYDEKNSWYQIMYDGSNKGWISGTYATKTE